MEQAILRCVCVCVQHVDFSSIQLITGEASTFSRYYVTTDEFGIFCTVENEFLCNLVFLY